MTENEWIVLLKKYMYQIRIAIDCCKVYDAVQEAKKYNFEKMKRAEYFFVTSINALAYRANMETEKLFDSRNHVCFQKILKKFEADGKLFLHYEGRYYCVRDIINNSYICGWFNYKEYKNKINKEFLQFENEIMNLRNQRDKVLAHNDKKYYPYQASLNEDFPFNGECLEILLDMFQQFCNVLLYVLTGQGVVPYDSYRYNDVDNLFFDCVV